MIELVIHSTSLMFRRCTYAKQNTGKTADDFYCGSIAMDKNLHRL